MGLLVGADLTEAAEDARCDLRAKRRQGGGILEVICAKPAQSFVERILQTLESERVLKHVEIGSRLRVTVDCANRLR